MAEVGDIYPVGHMRPTRPFDPHHGAIYEYKTNFSEIQRNPQDSEKNIPSGCKTVNVQESGYI